MTDYMHLLPGHGYAHRCGVCDSQPLFEVMRIGDVVTSWACGQHLGEVCAAMQRDFEVTELRVVHFPKACEWSGIGASLKAIADEQNPKPRRDF